ncbi:hypothetical protein GGR57DRAFT_288932 [Xylariaceae sp. FL1272]|nr:hypothetical protein GGR57DRAFT_288932 [Xylariaceae sp. FL1272]
MRQSLIHTTDAERGESAALLKLVSKPPRWATRKPYESLWARRIPDFAALKNHLRAKTAFVSLDIESYPDERIRGIGVAYLPILDGTRTKHGYLPSGNASMRAFGFARGYQLSTDRHCAGNDAVRFLALLTCLAHTPSTGLRLELEQANVRDGLSNAQMGYRHIRSSQDRSFLKSRRELFETDEFPFRAIVSMQDGLSLATEVNTAQKVEQYFGEYEIVGIGKVALKGRGIPFKKRYARSHGRYWVCLGGSDELSRFVKDNDQRILACGRNLSVQESEPCVKPRCKTGEDREELVAARQKARESRAQAQVDGDGFGFISNMEDLLG